MFNYSSPLGLKRDAPVKPSARGEYYVFVFINFELSLFICSAKIYDMSRMWQRLCSALRIRDGKDRVPAFRKVSDD